MVGGEGDENFTDKDFLTHSNTQHHFHIVKYIHTGEPTVLTAASMSYAQGHLAGPF